MTDRHDRYFPTTALVVVDVQNDFADPAGGLYVAGGDAVVPLVNEQITAARAAGSTVVFTQDWHPPETPHFVKDGGVWPVHCVRDTWGAQLHPGLVVPEDAPIVRKGVDGGDGYSGFSVRDPLSGERTSTELGRLLADAHVQRVVVVGLAGDVCVKETALDAVELGYQTVVPLSTTRMVELDEGDGQRAVAALRTAGVEIADG